MVKLLNKLRRDKNEPEAPAATPEDIQLLREIRDELKNKLNKVDIKTVPSVPFLLHSILYWTRDIDKLAKSQLSLAKQIEQGHKLMNQLLYMELYALIKQMLIF